MNFLEKYVMSNENVKSCGNVEDTFIYFYITKSYNRFFGKGVNLFHEMVSSKEYHEAFYYIDCLIKLLKPIDGLHPYLNEAKKTNFYRKILPLRINFYLKYGIIRQEEFNYIIHLENKTKNNKSGE